MNCSQIEKPVIIMDMGAAQRSIPKPAKPRVVDYHDYRSFLKDWFAYLEGVDSEFSLRKLARDAKVGVSNLSMMLNGHRGLSSGTLHRLRPHLNLTEADCDHLEQLRDLAEAPTAEARVRALNRIQKRKDYQARHPQEFETFRYLNHWFNVAIREMTTTPGFKFDAAWVQTQLIEKVPLEEIQQSLAFLEKYGFITRDPAATSESKNLQCMGGVYRLSLGGFHKEMLSQISKSIDSVASDARHILGHTFSFAEEDLGAVKTILNEALAKIENLKTEKTHNRVYHVTLAVAPLTKKTMEDDDE